MTTSTLGTIVRLQVQRSPIKIGARGLRRYSPEVIAPVVELRVDQRGATGLTADGELILDVHHANHPQTRDAKARGGLTFIGTGDYVALRARYGGRLADGIAAESILIEAAAGLAGRAFAADQVRIRTADGVVDLHQTRVAEPCVEFTRFCLDQDPSTTVGPDVTQGLIDLGDGARGYRTVASGTAVIRIGDVLELHPD